MAQTVLPGGYCSHLASRHLDLLLFFICRSLLLLCLWGSTVDICNLLPWHCPNNCHTSLASIYRSYPLLRPLQLLSFFTSWKAKAHYAAASSLGYIKQQAAVSVSLHLYASVQLKTSSCLLQNIKKTIHLHVFNQFRN